MNCCLNCKERTIACHATCERYLTSAKEYRERQELINKNRKKDIVSRQWAEAEKRRVSKRKRELARGKEEK